MCLILYMIFIENLLNFSFQFKEDFGITSSIKLRNLWSLLLLWWIAPRMRSFPSLSSLLSSFKLLNVFLDSYVTLLLVFSQLFKGLLPRQLQIPKQSHQYIVFVWCNCIWWTCHDPITKHSKPRQNKWIRSWRIWKPRPNPTQNATQVFKSHPQSNNARLVLKILQRSEENTFKNLFKTLQMQDKWFGNNTPRVSRK